MTSGATLMSNASQPNIATALTTQRALPALVVAIDDYDHRYTRDIRTAASSVLEVMTPSIGLTTADFLTAAREQRLDPDKVALNGLNLEQTRRLQALGSLLDSYLKLGETCSKLFDLEGNAGPNRLATERAQDALMPAIKRLAEEFLPKAT